MRPNQMRTKNRIRLRVHYYLGETNSIAIFGEPGRAEFEFVLTGRHMTTRCDGNSAEHVAFGGPIFYGHAADGFNEGPDHPGNVFWPQALSANLLYDALDGRQRARALVKKVAPRMKERPFVCPSGDDHALEMALMTAPEKRNPDLLAKLDAVAGRMFNGKGKAS